ncbi:MAG: lysostaphin resistance A-like protein [Clostridium sp.]
MGIFKNKYSEVRSGWKIVLTCLILFGLMIIPSIVISIIFIGPEIIENGGVVTESMLNIESDKIYILSATTIQNICFIAASILTWKIFEKKKIRFMGLTNIKNSYKELGVGLALGAITITIVAIVLILTGSVKLENSITSPMFTSDLIMGLVLFIAVGFGEEIFGRGYCMSVLKQTRNKWVILIVSSIIFSAMHMSNDGVGVLPLVNIFLVGIVFGYMYMKSSNIWMPIGFHITWNYFQGYVWGFQVSGHEVNGMYKLESVSESILNGGSFGPEGGLVVTFILALTFAFVAWYYKDKSIDDFLKDKVEASSKNFIA